MTGSHPITIELNAALDRAQALLPAASETLRRVYGPDEAKRQERALLDAAADESVPLAVRVANCERDVRRAAAGELD
jgi:hypothetical protein